MEKIKDGKRYSLEEAQEEARVLKLMLELGEYGCQTYEEAEFYLPDSYLDQAIIEGQATLGAAELNETDVDNPNNPIVDSDWGRWGEIDMLPENIFDEEDRDLYCPIIESDLSNWRMPYERI